MRLIVVLLLIISKCAGVKQNITVDNFLRLLLEPKVVNGEPAELGELPYQVGFKSPTFGKTTYYTFCGGSIIKPKVVLSAAHCFIPSKLSFFKYCSGRLDRKHYRSTYAIAGNLQMQVTYSARRNAGQWRRLHLITFPFSYHFPIDDISIVHLTSPFVFDKYVNSIPYASQYKDYTNLECLASGYGKKNKREFSYNLQKAYLEIMPPSVCNKVFGQKMHKFVCTLDRVTNVLQGDSGGPLVCKNTGDVAEGSRGLLIGIVSGGAQGRGTLFTRVSAFKQYIARGKSNPIKITIPYNELIILIVLWIM